MTSLIVSSQVLWGYQVGSEIFLLDHRFPQQSHSVMLVDCSLFSKYRSHTLSGMEQSMSTMTYKLAQDKPIVRPVCISTNIYNCSDNFIFCNPISGFLKQPFKRLYYFLGKYVELLKSVHLKTFGKKKKERKGVSLMKGKYRPYLMLNSIMNIL